MTFNHDFCSLFSLRILKIEMPDPLLKQLQKMKNFLEPSAFMDKQFSKIDGPVTILLYDLEC